MCERAAPRRGESAVSIIAKQITPRRGAPLLLRGLIRRILFCRSRQVPMAHVSFTSNIQRHVECPPSEAPGRTVREVLDVVFAANPRARGYVLDDQGALRKHMVIFIDGDTIRDRRALS